MRPPTQWATYWIGSPASVSGTTFAPDRTATVTSPPARAISLAISAPEFPTPTTSTRRPAYPSGRRYATLCAIRPAKRSCPGKCGVLGLATIPVATTTARAASTPRLVLTVQVPSVRVIRSTWRPVSTGRSKARA